MRTQGQLGAHEGADALAALQRDRAVQRLDPVSQPVQAGAGAVAEACAADAVVLDLQREPAVRRLRAHARHPRPCVLDDVRQRLGDDVVGGRLDRLGQPLGQLEVELDGERRAGGEHLERRAQAALGEHGRVDALRQLAQLGERLG